MGLPLKTQSFCRCEMHLWWISQNALMLYICMGLGSPISSLFLNHVKLYISVWAPWTVLGWNLKLLQYEAYTRSLGSITQHSCQTTASFKLFLRLVSWRAHCNNPVLRFPTHVLPQPDFVLLDWPSKADKRPSYPQCYVPTQYQRWIQEACNLDFLCGTGSSFSS